MSRSKEEFKMEDGLVDDFLSHYGIKGMRWGVRRSDDELGRARGKGKSEEKDDGSDSNSSSGSSGGSSTPAPPKPLSELSTQELRDYVERVRLTQEVSRLTTSKSIATPGPQNPQNNQAPSQNKSSEKKQEKFISNLAKTTVKTVVASQTQRLASSLVDHMLDQKFEKSGKDYLRKGYKQPLERKKKDK